jgi:23S rRNA (cytidine2498-2'-O)-methyltransferase
MNAERAFVFVTCQVGAESAVKAELANIWPGWKFAYSRPGFLTFKLPENTDLADDFALGSVFARAYGFSLGTVKGADPEQTAQAAWRLVRGRTFDRLHVWQRDTEPPGSHGFEPAITPLARTASLALHSHVPVATLTAPKGDERGVVARPNDLVLDCVIVAPGEWCLGYHRAKSALSCLPGGLRAATLPPEAVSRAYLKMEDALLWSGFPLKPGELCAEIGCAPGGSSQALLDRGLHVIGIDPADVEPCVLAHPHFTYIKKRGADVRRREFRKVRWLAADINVAPNYTLDTVEAIVTHPEVNVRGLLLTLKLLDWELAAEIPDYLDRVRSWGYGDARAQQLQHHRQEFCIAASKRPLKSARRPAQGSFAQPSLDE